MSEETKDTQEPKNPLQERYETAVKEVMDIKEMMVMPKREMTAIEKLEERFYAMERMLNTIRWMREENRVPAPDAMLAEDRLKGKMLEMTKEI